MKNVFRALAFTILLWAPSLGFSQSQVAVTATVTSVANSAPFIYGTYTIQLVDSVGTALQSVQVGAGTTTLTRFTGTLSSTGSLSISLYANSDLYAPGTPNPAGTHWKFTPCSAGPATQPFLSTGNPVCYSSLVTVGGAGDYSAQISAGSPAIYYVNYQTGIAYISSSDSSVRDSATDPTGVACTSAAPILRYTATNIYYGCGPGNVYATLAVASGGPFLPITGGTLTGSLAGPSVNGTQLFAAGINGAACNDSTDDTTALNALISNVYTAGGGQINVVGKCLISGAVLLPNNGNSSAPTQPAIRITGYGSSYNGYWTAPPASPSVLDMRYNAAVAKIDTRGAWLCF